MTPSSHRDANHPEHARRAIDLVLRAAGLPTDGYTSTPLGPLLVNATYLIQFDAGDRYVARIYRWPFDGPDDLDRAAKEMWLSDLLRRYGIPAPRVLTKVETDDGTAVLCSFLPGQTLGDLSEINDGAWRTVGESLARVHEIQVGDGSAGVIVGSRVRPFSEGSWGGWQLANALAHSEQVARHGEYDIDPDRVGALYQRAVTLFDERPVRLLHNDPHAWNVLVDCEPAGWRCTGWLDWEFAWAGDPAWDLARLDIFRLKDIGPTPLSFYEGYAAGPAPIVSELYEFAILLWMANQAATGDQTLLPTYRRAHRHLLRAPAVLANLEQLVPQAEG
ncbi:phosphotransferase family protein [Flindersiella endophytica]